MLQACHVVLPSTWLQAGSCSASRRPAARFSETVILNPQSWVASVKPAGLAQQGCRRPTAHWAPDMRPA